MIGSHNSPLPLFFKYHVPVQNWDTIKNNLDDLIELQNDQHGLELGNSISTYNVKRNGEIVNPLDWDCLQYLVPEIWKVVFHATKQWNLDYTEFDVTQCWTNKHKYTGKTAFHKHGVNTHYVIAYYLNVPKDGGDLLMIDPLQYHWNSYSSKVIDTNNNLGWRQKVNTGDMIIMPNFLIHGTDENKNINEDRYVLTINVLGRFIGENV
jgi:hypothetical protein